MEVSNKNSKENLDVSVKKSTSKGEPKVVDKKKEYEEEEKREVVKKVPKMTKSKMETILKA